MTETIERPSTLRINAWTGKDAPVQDLPAWTPWAQKERGADGTQYLAPATPINGRRWDHPDVGWGLVLPERGGLSPADLATAADAPHAIQRLLASRPGSPVLRVRPGLRRGYLRRYYPNSKAQDLRIQAPRPGVGEGQIPRYLLIFGSPAEIPWEMQYALNMSTYVGRLDLDGQALENYVNALLSDWRGQECDPRSPVVWSVDYGAPDITFLMARAIADRLWMQMAADPDLTRGVYLTGGSATRAKLAATLAERKPALLLTTSQGMTGPLDNPQKLKAQLGVPVDAHRRPMMPADLSDWSPCGAIWYAHACCSAGSDAASRYTDLLSPEGAVGDIINGVAKTAGAIVAPLARALLGAERPLRAFIGHVEPTFDWTLRDPSTRQPLTHVLVSSLYNKLCERGEYRTPIGHALAAVYNEAGNFFAALQDDIRGINHDEPGMRDWALYDRLVAMDRQMLVILGDPTVALPRLT